MYGIGVGGGDITCLYLKKFVCMPPHVAICDDAYDVVSVFD
jgi:hypothetical protein